MVIALEGLPGAGKTTSAALLADRLGVAAVCETTQDHPFLQTIYDDGTRYDLQVELAFALLHNAAFREIPADSPVVTDFSPVKDLLFAEAMLSGSDLALFESVYSHLYADQRMPTTTVYLDASPELCLERVRQRLALDPNRHFELGLGMDRLQQMADIYESRLAELGDRVIRLPITGDLNKETVVDQLSELLKPI